MKLLRALANGWLWFLLVTTWPLGWALGLVLMLFTHPFDPHRRVPHRFFGFWCHQYLRCWPTWSVRVRGTERVPPGACVLVANHQSAADIPALMGLGVNFKFVSKAELFDLPLLGYAMRKLNYVPIERGRLASMEKMMARCRTLLVAGDRVLLFPEGTYASGGRRLPFKRGAFKLAQELGVPVVPVVITGAEALCVGDGPLFALTGNVVVEVMEPVQPPPPGADEDGWVRQLEEAFAKWLGQEPPIPRRRPGAVAPAGPGVVEP